MRQAKKITVDEAFCAYREEGSFRKAARQLHIHEEKVKNVLLSAGLIKTFDERDKEIVASYDGIRSAKEVGDELSLPPRIVLRVWEKNGLKGLTENAKAERKTDAAMRALEKGHKKVSEEDGAEYVRHHSPQFEYVSGYTGSDSTIKVKCRKCGSTIEVSCVTLRMSKGTCHCAECDALERAKREEQLKAEQEKRKQERKEAQDAERETRKQRLLEVREAKKRTVTCPVCGKPFETYKRNVVCCSIECSKKRLNHKKDRRLNASNTIDKDITLERLYRRDHGRCYLCGRQCDWDDYEVVDGTVICGNDYPSVEHVKPLSKGGMHSWGNVKLACRGCNTAKHDRIIDATEATEQLRLFA